MSTKTGFEKEAKGNSEMVYWHQTKGSTLKRGEGCCDFSRLEKGFEGKEMNFRCSLLTFLQLLVVPNTCDEEKRV